MYVITPNGTVFDVPIARHAVPGEGGITRLFADTECQEWIMDVPQTFVVSGTRPKMPGVSQDDYDSADNLLSDQRERRTFYLFGLCPLWEIRKGLDRGFL